MASANFDQKHFELARKTRYVIEFFLETSQKLAGLYASTESIFSSFAVLSDFIAYEASIRVTIQDFALTHFELGFPTYHIAMVEAHRETESQFPSWFDVPPISLLFNISITQIPIATERALQIKKEPRGKSLPPHETPEPPLKIKAKAAREPEATTLFSRVALLQSELAATVTSRLEMASSAFLESQKKLLTFVYLAPPSESALLRKTGFEEAPTERFPTPKEVPQVEAVQAARTEVPTGPAERKVKREDMEAEIEEPPQRSLFSWAVTIQSELLTRIAPTLEVESMLLQNQKQALLVTSAASESRVTLIEKTQFEEIAASQVAVLPDAHEIESAKKVKRRTVEEQPPETWNETLLKWVISIRRQLMARLTSPFEIESKVLESQKKTVSEPSITIGPKTASPEEPPGEEVQTTHIPVPEEKTAEMTGGIKAAPEPSWLIAYVNRLPTLMLEAQKPFSTALYSSKAFINYGEPLIDVTTESKTTLSHPAVPHSVVRKAPLPPYWVERVVLPMLDSLRAISTFPVATSTTQRIQRETVTSKIPTFEMMPRETGVEMVEPKQTAASPNLKAEERHIEAIRLPTILAQLLNSYLRKSPTTYPTFQEQLLGKTSLEEEPSFGKMGKKQLGAESVGAKKPISRIFSFSQKAPEERTEHGPAAFIEELQLVHAVYGRELSELAVSGPVRATMLSELTSGVLVPSLPESEISAEPLVPEIIKSNFPEKSTVSERLRRAFPEEESININVFEGTAEEDLRELERKIGRILAEQLAEPGRLGSLGTTLPGEPSFGSARTSAELGALDSQTISSALLRRSYAGEGNIILNAFTEAANEDMKELERKIRRILSAQISRYYGSSSP